MCKIQVGVGGVISNVYILVIRVLDFCYFYGMVGFVKWELIGNNKSWMLIKFVIY